VEGGGIIAGGVGAGPPGAALPPGASRFGVRSLSLVLSDFGTLFLFLSLIFYSLFLVLVSSVF